MMNRRTPKNHWCNSESSEFATNNVEKIPSYLGLRKKGLGVPCTLV